jgi:hypothetical protein
VHVHYSSSFHIFPDTHHMKRVSHALALHLIISPHISTLLH